MTHILRFSPSLLSLLTCLSLGFTSCSSTSKKPDEEAGTTATDTYEVVVDATPFYRLGPQQGSGPDLSLAKGDLVKMLKRSYGYSRVEVENGWSGYVATDDIEPSTAVPEAAEDLSGNSAVVERYYVNEEPDFPPLPEEELDISTGVASPTDPQESELPRFRY